MSKDRKYWKLYAKRTLSGNWGLAIAGMIVSTAVNLIGNYMASFLFPGVTVSAMLLSQVFLFIVSLIAMIFTSGYIYMLLNMSRGREYGLGDLFHMFRNQPDRVLVAGFVLSLIDNILLLPLTYWTVMTSPAAETMEAYLSWVQTAGILMVLGMALAVVIKLPLSLTFFLLADHPEMGGVEALKTSVRLMKGKKWKYFVLQLSFVPLLILSAFTLYIAMLWLIPYMNAADTAFYMDACGEFGHHPEDDAEEPGRITERPAGDDYNAEA